MPCLNLSSDLIPDRYCISPVGVRVGFINFWLTVKILKIGTPEIITIIVLQLEQLDFTVQYCVQKMQTELQTEKTLIRLLHEEQSDLGLHCLLRPVCPNI